MIESLTLKSESFGIDISDLSLKIARLQKRGRFLRLSSFNEMEIKQGIIENGWIKDEEALAKIIQESIEGVKGEKIRTKNIIASLPEKKAFLEVIQLPLMGEEELNSAVSFEAENYIPLPISQVYLGFETVKPLVNHQDHLDVMVAALPKAIIDSYVSCFKKANLVLRALEIEPQSICRALIKNGKSESPVALIDFGKTDTNFMIFSGTSLRFTSSIPISSQQLTQAISDHTGVDLERAEKLKIKYGLHLSDRSKKDSKEETQLEKIIDKNKIFEAMAPILNDLVDEIKRYVAYYQTHSSHDHIQDTQRKIEKILLCGRGANLKGLADFLSVYLKIPAQLGNPWINILPEPLKEVPELPFTESLGYTSALGLALRGIRGE